MENLCTYQHCNYRSYARLKESHNDVIALGDIPNEFISPPYKRLTLASHHVKSVSLYKFA